MVVDNWSKAEADRVFHALADATRRDIVTRTMVREHSVSALAQCYTMSFAAIQKHVAVLERANLITKQRRGREQIVRADVATVRRAASFLDAWDEMWRQRAQRIDDLL